MRALSLLCLAPALVAQAQAPSLEASVNAKKAAIEGLVLTDPMEAFAQAQALVPAAAPAFDKSSPVAVDRSRKEVMAYMNALFLLGRTARVTGDFEKAMATYALAVEAAKAAKADTQAGLQPSIDAWKGAEEKAKAALEAGKARMDELNAKPADQRTADEVKELENFKIHGDNAARAPKVVAQLSGIASDWDAYVKAAQNNLEIMDKRLKSEAEDRAKPGFKGSLKLYIDQATKDVMGSTTIDKEGKLTFFGRMLKLDPAHKQARHRLDVELGKAVDKPEPAAKKKAPRKKGK